MTRCARTHFQYKMDEKEYETILQYLKFQKYPEESTDNEKRRIRAKKDIFVIKTHDGMDYLYTKNEGLAVVTAAKKESVLKMCHIHRFILGVILVSFNYL